MRTNIEIEEAIQLIISHTPHPAADQVAAKDAHGRVLAEDVTAPIDQPPWPRSPLDGYAFHAADSRGASKVSPVTLEVVDTV
jgi:molybdopterin molybdotransferase